MLGLFVNPPYGFAPEDNLAYAHVIRLHLAGIAQLNKRYPGATVLSAWPMTDELTRPELGYLKKPYDVYRIEDFTAEQIARAAAEPEKYSAALVFSTKYDPPRPLLSLGGRARRWTSDSSACTTIFRRKRLRRELGGTLVWKGVDQGQWVALIRFERVLDASVRMQDRPR